MASQLQAETHARPPWWRDEQTLKVVLQVLFIIAIALVAGVLYRNMRIGLDELGLSFGFQFLSNTANFGIGEGIPYTPSDSYLKAILVGAINTMWVSFFSILLATVMGLLLGMARLSSNWLAEKLAGVVTEVFRNIPVLLIIIFWYQGVLLQLPRVRSSISLFDVVFLSNRGLNFPSLTPSLWLIPTLIVAAAVLWAVPKLLKDRPNFPTIGIPVLAGWLGFVLVCAGFWNFAPETPLAVDVPVLGGFNYRGGWKFSVEFLAVMMGLVTYTGAYIAEVVRGAFLAVPRGQWEASRAIGLSELNTFRLVIVPQALRIMLPSLNTQFLTLIKNSSLAIAVGYSDLFNIGSTVINQSGRSVEVFAIVMVSYLSMNLGVSYFMNWLNNRVKLVER
ncbi:amino acid ABC transporter permease [Synechococcus sp. PCC 7336]|uniref:amino acid ABC transporter permease n=1 Tax=Synechococcus sp. PCC 7336 TaxID=195250 RepID=UPI00034B2829|nr:ABC transporter permease subunit [Synechococcus sp. PCC 7336]